jgi:hypothetical protein
MSSAGSETPPEMIRFALPAFVGVIASFVQSVAGGAGGSSASAETKRSNAKRFMALPPPKEGSGAPSTPP